MPTTYSFRYTNVTLIPLYDADQARARAVNLAPSQTLAAGTILGELTATPGTYKAYASGNSDGSQIPKLILAAPVITDSSGNITFSATAGTVGNEFGAQDHTAPCWANGVFKTTDLTGLDSNAVSVMGAHYEEGNLSAGIIRFP